MTAFNPSIQRTILLTLQLLHCSFLDMLSHPAGRELGTQVLTQRKIFLEVFSSL